MENPELKGYTQEEFESLLSLMGLSSLLKTMKGWGGDTPEDRFLIIETYRRVIADRDRAMATDLSPRSVNGKY